MTLATILGGILFSLVVGIPLGLVISALTGRTR